MNLAKLASSFESISHTATPKEWEDIICGLRYSLRELEFGAVINYITNYGNRSYDFTHLTT